MREYVWLGDQPIAMIQDDGVYYIHVDHLNTPKIVTDQQQQVVWKGDYKPFGEVQETVETVEMNLRFPGQYEDRETGLNYNVFRSYSAHTGRYSQTDPIGLFGGINVYSYGYEDPIYFIDPLGLSGTPRTAQQSGRRYIPQRPGKNISDTGTHQPGGPGRSRDGTRGPNRPSGTAPSREDAMGNLDGALASLFPYGCNAQIAGEIKNRSLDLELEFNRAQPGCTRGTCRVCIQVASTLFGPCNMGSAFGACAIGNVPPFNGVASQPGRSFICYDFSVSTNN